MTSAAAAPNWALAPVVLQAEAQAVENALAPSWLPPGSVDLTQSQRMYSSAVLAEEIVEWVPPASENG